MVCLRVFTSCDAHCVPCRRPKTFLHGPGAAVGIAIFNSIGAIGTSHMSYAARTGQKEAILSAAHPIYALMGSFQHGPTGKHGRIIKNLHCNFELCSVLGVAANLACSLHCACIYSAGAATPQSNAAGWCGKVASAGLTLWAVWWTAAATSCACKCWAASSSSWALPLPVRPPSPLPSLKSFPPAFRHAYTTPALKEQGLYASLFVCPTEK